MNLFKNTIVNLKNHFYPGVDEEVKLQPRIHPVKQSFIIQEKHLNRIENKVAYSIWVVETIKRMVSILVATQIVSVVVVLAIVTESLESLIKSTTNMLNISITTTLLISFFICFPLLILVVSGLLDFALSFTPRPSKTI